MSDKSDERRVRPIPIDDNTSPNALPPLFEPDSDDVSHLPRRPWLPLALAAGAIVIVVTSVAAFGALQFEDPPPLGADDFASTGEEIDGSTTTVTTIPPRLEDLLGGRSDRLTVMAERDDMLWALTWDPSFREPKVSALDLMEDLDAVFTESSFDRGGRAVAVTTCGESVCDLYVGTVRDVAEEPDVEGILGYQWHASEVARVAWVAPAGTGYEVTTATVSARTGALEDVAVAFSSSDPIALVQWDTSGFVVNSLVPTASTIAYAPNGDELWSQPGAAVSGTADVVAVFSDASTWTLVDRRSGEPLESNSDLRDGAIFITTSESSDLVGTVSVQGDGPATLEVTGGDLRAKRVVTIPEGLTPVGFTEDGTFFLLIDDDHVAFVDWNRGGTRRAMLPSGYRILGLHLG